MSDFKEIFSPTNQIAYGQLRRCDTVSDFKEIFSPTKKKKKSCIRVILGVAVIQK